MLQKKSISLEEHEKIVKILQDALKRKDKEIEELKKENNLAVQTALKQASKNECIMKELEKLKEENKKLRGN